MNNGQDQLINKITAAVKNELHKRGYIPVSQIAGAGSAPAGAGGAAGTLLNKRLVTEEMVRDLYKQGCSEITVLARAIITPLAKDFILHNKIKLTKKR